MKKVALSLLVLGLIMGGGALAADPEPPISLDQIKETIERLAGEEFLGREAGSEGGKKASDWIASECEKLGLKPAGDEGTYFQHFKAQGRNLRNVVATLPAREASDLADEVLVIGSHYDHLGKGGFGSLDFMTGSDKVHYGADDNASGSTGNLTLARALCATGPARRRIVFVWFDGEELGLFGSKRYVKKPSFPLEKTVAMLNMDMIGRLRKDKLTVYGVNTGSVFAAIEKHAEEGSDLKIDLKDTMPPNSDHFSFYQKKVPVIALFTGLHKDYHRATDTVDKIELGGMKRVLRYAYRVVRGVADADGRAEFAQAKDGNAEAMVEQITAMLDDEQLQKLFGGEDGIQKLFKEGGLSKVLEKLRGSNIFGGGGSQKPRFGISTRDSEAGVTIEQVYEGTIAEKTGVKEGDKVLAFDGKDVKDFASLQAAIKAAKGKVKLTIERDGQKLELTADFGAEPRKKRWL